METVKIGALEIDPQKNPAVLDTGSWDFAATQEVVEHVPDTFFEGIVGAMRGNLRPQAADPSLFICDRLEVFPGSYARKHNSDWYLARSKDDGQRVILEMGGKTGKNDVSPNPYSKLLGHGTTLRVYPTDAKTLDRYFRTVDPEKGPRPLGGVPRIGIGVRHSTFIWPGAIEAMHRKSFSANLIQNSVRELHALKALTEGREAKENYLFSFGRIQEGHTGSTFEGLWVYGALEALASSTMVRYGADADHIQVKRGAGGLNRAKEYLDASPFYSFYTVDVSDVLNYQAAWESSAAAAARFLEDAIPNENFRRDILSYHGKQRWFFGRTYASDEAEIGRFIGKYWAALDTVEELVSYIRSLKNGVPFDLEISIDETPAEIPTFDAITSESELLFLINEITRRGIPVTHLAPNFGVEKGTDYRGPDGLLGLEYRMHRLYLIASELGFFLDCHSGDDLRQATRQTVGRATGGNIHFKVSPSLQVLYAETLYAMYPEKFEWWWNDTYAWVKREAEAGSTFAIDCFREFERSDNPRPHPNHALFEHYNFATVGRRADDGSFVNRDRFYDLPAEFDREIKRRVADRLSLIATDVFDHPPAY